MLACDYTINGPLTTQEEVGMAALLLACDYKINGALTTQVRWVWLELLLQEEELVQEVLRVVEEGGDVDHGLQEADELQEEVGENHDVVEEEAAVLDMVPGVRDLGVEEVEALAGLVHRRLRCLVGVGHLTGEVVTVQAPCPVQEAADYCCCCTDCKTNTGLS